jgi:hypothetical protein
MKLFNSIQELWEYCEFCPLCSKNCRPVDISVGPDMVFKLSSFQKNSDSLDLHCSFGNKSSVYLLDYSINCMDNTFDIQVSDETIIEPVHVAKSKRVKEAYFFFYVQGICPECECSTANSFDLEFDMLERRVVNIGLERETFSLYGKDEQFYVTLSHDRNVMLVSKIHQSNKKDGNFIFGPPLELPLVNLSLSDLEKAINKIKTLILFS